MIRLVTIVIDETNKTIARYQVENSDWFLYNATGKPCILGAFRTKTLWLTNIKV